MGTCAKACSEKQLPAKATIYQPTSSSYAMTSFDSLSRELRVIIYTYSLVVEVEIIAHPLPHDINREEYKMTKAQYPSPGKDSNDLTPLEHVFNAEKYYHKVTDTPKPYLCHNSLANS